MFAGNMKLERFSFLTAFVRKLFCLRGDVAFSRAETLDSLRLARLVLKKFSFVGAANRLPTLLSGSLLAFQSAQVLPHRKQLPPVMPAYGQMCKYTAF